MQWTIFNGSPRGAKSNTRLLTEAFCQGLAEAGEVQFRTVYLMREPDMKALVGAFAASDGVILGFPLYTDAMPGIVKEFIEALDPLCGRQGLPQVVFLVQSGFPEATHSRRVARYLAKLTERLGCASPGTIVKGGGEGLRESTGRRRNSALVALRRLGERYASTGNLDTDLLRQVAGFERMPTVVLCVFRVLGWLGLGDVMWRGRMRENGCYAQRKARPYV